MRKIKVLIIGQLPPPVHGSNVMATLFMESLLRLGHEIRILQKDFSRNMAEVEKISFRKIAKIPLITLKLILELKQEKPDLCVYFIAMGLAAFIVDSLFIAILRIFGVPFILYCHGKGLKKMGTDNPLIIRRVVSWTVSGAVGALVLGESLKEDLTSYLNVDRLYTLPNAIPDINREEHHLNNRGNTVVRILFLSNIIETKGPMDFLQMAKEVIYRAPHVQFVLAGLKTCENFYKRLIDFIEQEGLGDFVELPGGLYGEAKYQGFRESDIFVYPTKLDAFPLVILEAMQWGYPVISTGEGAIPDMVINGENGFIVNPGDVGQLADRVLQLVQDQGLRLQMGKKSRKRYKEFFDIKVYHDNIDKAMQFFQNKIFRKDNLD